MRNCGCQLKVKNHCFNDKGYVRYTYMPLQNLHYISSGYSLHYNVIEISRFCRVLKYLQMCILFLNTNISFALWFTCRFQSKFRQYATTRYVSKVNRGQADTILNIIKCPCIQIVPTQTKTIIYVPVYHTF